MERIDTFKTKIFWKFFSPYVVIFLVFFGACIFIFEMARWEIEIQNVRELIIILLSGCGFIGLIFGYKRSASLIRPIYEMNEVCEALQKGNYNTKVRSISKDELGKLGETLNQLGSEITTKIETILFERAQLKTILANMVEGIVSLDAENRLQFCNAAAYNLLGSDLRDARGHVINNLKGFHLLTELVERARSSSVQEEDEILIEEKHSFKILECYASTFKIGDTNSVIIVLHNVTELRHLERVRRDFVANASHEIKTPLTNIKGYAETLLSGALRDPEFSRKFVEKIDNNANRLTHIVKDLLSLAKLEGQDDSFRVTPTTWEGIITQGLSRYEHSIHKKHLRVIVDHESIKNQVLGDHESMTQIFDNLLSNSIRYTPDGGEIRISVTREDRYCLLHVEDTGIGIKKKHLERIFERFYRVDKARSRELGGTGLGLAIVKHLVTNMNGQVSVASTLGTGSRFTIALESTT